MAINVNFNNRLIWIVIVTFIGVVTGTAIGDGKWLYLGLAVSPVIIWISIEKPFIFPFGLYVFLLPFDKILTLFNIGQASTITKFIGILTILVLSIKGAIEHKLVKPNIASILCILLIVYSTITASWAIDSSETILGMQTLAGLVLLYLVVSSYKIKKSDFELVEWCILAGGIIATLLMIYNFNLGHTHRKGLIAYGETELGPNQLAVAILIPLSIAIKMMLQNKIKMKKFLFGGIIVAMLYAILLTSSRSASIGVALIVIVYILTSKHKITYGIIAVICIIIFLSLFTFYNDDIFKRWEQVAETGGSGRTDIWYIGLKSLEKYWLFGAGYKNFPLAFHEYINYSSDREISEYYNAHNLYLQIFVELGIFGIALLGLFIWKHFKVIHSRIAYYGLDRIMLLGPFWAFVITSAFRNSFTEKSFWLLWILIMMHKNITDDEPVGQCNNIRSNIVNS
ncbi:MAG: hypothetical protein SCALA701_02500 [Candidatus Scalindua sp.]|nr:O-antigen ligase family protein [Planctomycetota bacterium]GJQ57449.1 MAG: hypothetical protein SCALA701_02500 [Candidatus Scalindua sp.]